MLGVFVCVYREHQLQDLLSNLDPGKLKNSEPKTLRIF